MMRIHMPNGHECRGGGMLPVQVRNQLIFVMAHSRSEVSNPSICLLRPPEVGNRAQYCYIF